MAKILNKENIERRIACRSAISNWSDGLRTRWTFSLIWIMLLLGSCSTTFSRQFLSADGTWWEYSFNDNCEVISARYLDQCTTCSASDAEVLPQEVICPSGARGVVDFIPQYRESWYPSSGRMRVYLGIRVWEYSFHEHQLVRIEFLESLPNIAYNITDAGLAHVPPATPANAHNSVDDLASTMPTAASTTVPTPTFTPGTTRVSIIDGMVQVYVPAGEFIIGDTEQDIDRMLELCSPSDRSWYEGYSQEIEYLEAYWIDQTEVTNAMYAACVSAGACNPQFKIGSETRDQYYGNTTYDNYPMININWHDATTYCEWAGRRLPTEAEWEKAARGTDGRFYPWGNNDANCDLANFAWCAGETVEVGSYPDGVSPYGVYNMAGNVTEWVSDWHEADPYGRWPVYRVWRGGAFSRQLCWSHTTSRLVGHPDWWATDVGFRCAQDTSP